ncbi:MAG: hypothetical protein K2N00_03800, partial [Lachnospiraceae bacterium]|nr:hypothetical protein [Lachnospiraceae bacterium]
IYTYHFIPKFLCCIMKLYLKTKSNRLKMVDEEIVHELNSVYLKSNVEQMRFLIAKDKGSLRTVIENAH